MENKLNLKNYILFNEARDFLFEMPYFRDPKTDQTVDIELEKAQNDEKGFNKFKEKIEKLFKGEPVISKNNIPMLLPNDDNAKRSFGIFLLTDPRFVNSFINKYSNISGEDSFANKEEIGLKRIWEMYNFISSLISNPVVSQEKFIEDIQKIKTNFKENPFSSSSPGTWEAWLDEWTSAKNYMIEKNPEENEF